MAVQNPKDEQIVFVSPDPAIQPVQLLVNPETLTLAWKKVLTRQRTKTRMLTYFWGEEPLRFTYRGQTGYTYPTEAEVTGGGSTQSSALSTQLQTLQQQYTTLFNQNTSGGPYTYGTAQGNTNVLNQLNAQIANISQAIATQSSTYANLSSLFTNTQIQYFSEKFRLLKKLEFLYRRHQDPAQALLTLHYRDYLFKGYFESFNYTDDSRSPWNWIYTIDFTILDWKETIEATTSATGEIVFAGSQSITTLPVITSPSIQTIDQQ